MQQGPPPLGEHDLGGVGKQLSSMWHGSPAKAKTELRDCARASF